MRKSVTIYDEVGDDYGRVEYVQHMGSDQMIIDAARVSYANETSEWRGNQDKGLLRYLIKHKHWSPFEHCSITWHIVVPLFVRGQWHRHRTWSYNEISRRYTSEGLEFYLPDWLRPQAKKNKQASDWEERINPILSYRGDGPNPANMAIREHVEDSVALYNALLDSGVCREQARMVLPQNMYVRYYGSVNLRNALAFIKLREDNHAQWEIFQPAKVMREHLQELFPEALAAYDDVMQR